MPDHKSDNAHLRAKLELRRHFLKKYPGPFEVLDCCQGSGTIWHKLGEEFKLASYLGVDLKPKKGRLKIDSVDLVSQPGLRQNVIDVDTYGSPWKHFEGICRYATRPTTIFLTHGIKNRTVEDASISELLGLHRLKPNPRRRAFDSCSFGPYPTYWAKRYLAIGSLNRSKWSPTGIRQPTITASESSQRRPKLHKNRKLRKNPGDVTPYSLGVYCGHKKKTAEAATVYYCGHKKRWIKCFYRDAVRHANRNPIEGKTQMTTILENETNLETVGTLRIQRGHSHLKGLPTVQIWRGKATRPYANFYFNSVERREAFIAEQIRYADESELAKANRKVEGQIEKQKMIEALQVGQILHYSWGYDQTQCEFFQIVEKSKSGASVVIREIASETVPGSESFMSDRRTPVRDHFIGEPMKKIITRYGISMDHGVASAVADTYAGYCSWYA